MALIWEPVPEEEVLPYKLDKVIFGLISPTDARKIGFIEITEPTAYDEGGLPVQGGVLDPRLGTINPRQRCPVCGNLPKNCPGHFGRIELAMPVVHIGYVKRIKDALNTVCHKCGKVLLPQDRRAQFIERALEYAKDNPEKVVDDELVRAVRDYVKIYTKKHRKCPHCGAPIHRVELEEVYKFIVKEPEPRRLWPNEIRDILERVSNEDSLLIGFDPERARPEWAVLTVLLVPPLTTRPSIYLETGERSEDDLTHILVELLKANRKLSNSKKMGAPVSMVESEWDHLQYWVSVFFNNATANMPVAMQKGTKRPLKSLFQRLSGKEGRLRKNLIGKRVNFSARTVISPDPMIDIDEVGVPVEIAMVLTVPEYVNESNIERMKELVIRGPDEYPGANAIRKGGVTPISLKILQRKGKDALKEAAEQLEPGDIVERHLMDGDYVIFNRQPSLHKLSMLGHRVKVLPGATFRLHPAVCVPYNADFDGDEMNLHVPQILDGSIEVRELMGVKYNMLSPRTGGSIIGARQDFITALYMITKKDSFFDKKEAARILSRAGITELPEPAIKRPRRLWTGKQLISVLLPKDLNFEGIAKSAAKASDCRDPSCPGDGYVLIRGGNLLSGVLDDNIVGTLVKGKLTLTDVLIRDYGEDVAMEFLNKLLKIAAKEVLLYGVSNSPKELMIPEEAKREIEDIYSNMKDEVMKLIRSRPITRKIAIYRTKEELLRLMREEQMLEFDIVQTIDSFWGKVSNVISKYIDPKANVSVMAKTGARGSMANLGQQKVKTRIGFVLTSGRPRKGYRDRVLSYFQRGDLSPEARGFVKNSYVTGLNPAEFVFHAMSSRESLIDKGRRTEDSGYFYRRVANSLKDVYVSYDETVRDSMGHIIQFKFGGDGYDPTKLFRGDPIDVERVIGKHVKGERKRGVAKERIEEALKEADLPTSLAEKIFEAKPRENELEAIVEELKEGFERAKVEVLTPIGLISAQSIAEPTTQMVLRTFHAPGLLAMDVTHGVERFKELVFYASTSTPTMKIYLKPKCQEDLSNLRKILRNLRELRVRDLIEEYAIDNFNYQLILKPDRRALESNKIPMERLINLIKSTAKSMKGEVSLEGDTIVVELYEAASKEKPLQTLRSWSYRILDKTISGVRGIKRAWVETVETDGRKEYIIRTSGSNLAAVLSMGCVDISRTITNDCKEVERVLGIEAARNCIFNELASILEEQGLEVDRRYISLVADTMTYSGTIEAIRLQAAGVSSGFFSEMKTPLSKMAFEWTTHVILNTARRGEVNRILGPLDALIMGQTPPIGTGKVSVLWDLGGKQKEVLGNG
ncbi:MAG: DNA-directed RNA polymerase subunit A' [Candidatus Korarchaeum sp.]